MLLYQMIFTLFQALKKIRLYRHILIYYEFLKLDPLYQVSLMLWATPIMIKNYLNFASLTKEASKVEAIKDNETMQLYAIKRGS